MGGLLSQQAATTRARQDLRQRDRPQATRQGPGSATVRWAARPLSVVPRSAPRAQSSGIGGCQKFSNTRQVTNVTTSAPPRTTSQMPKTNPIAAVTALAPMKNG